jgi:hypothetical protein
MQQLKSFERCIQYPMIGLLNISNGTMNILERDIVAIKRINETEMGLACSGLKLNAPPRILKTTQQAWNQATKQEIKYSLTEISSLSRQNFVHSIHFYASNRQVHITHKI